MLVQSDRQSQIVNFPSETKSLCFSFFPGGAESLRDSSARRREFFEMRLISSLYTVNTHPTDQVFSSRGSFPLEIHEAAQAKNHIHSGTDWAAGHTRRFVDRDVLTEIFPLNGFVDCLEKRWTIIGVGFDCLRAQLE